MVTVVFYSARECVDQTTRRLPTRNLFGDLRLVPEWVPGAKHIKHRGQDSVDSSFSN